VSERVDLLGDDLVHVQHVQPPVDISLHDAVAPTAEPTQHVKGLCSICTTKAAAEKCLHCNRVVCREHFWIMLGLCKGCATEEERQRALEGPPRKSFDLDIKWIED